MDNERESSISSKCYQLIPITGGFSAISFSTNVMNPKLFSSVFGSRDITVANSLWFNAHLGIGLYIYNCRHIKQAPFYRRLLYSTFGAAVFNFGSVLFWAASKTVLPKNDAMKTLFGVISGAAFLVIGRDYLMFIDKNTQEI